MSLPSRDRSIYEFPGSFQFLGNNTLSDSSATETRTWTLKYSEGHDPALVIDTDVHPHQSIFRVYPRFKENKKTITNPRLFPVVPQIYDFSGSWIELHYNPLEEIQIAAIYWAPGANILCGEVKLVNSGANERLITLEMVFGIRSSRKKELTHLVSEGKNLLYGQSEDQHLICFVSGSPEPAPDLSSTLSNSLAIKPGKSTKIRWITILAGSKEAGIGKLNKAILVRWKDEISRKNIARQDQFSISTDNLELDFALKYSRCQAENLLKVLENNAADSTLQAITSLEGLLLFQALYPPNPLQVQSIIDLVFRSQIDDEYPEPELPADPFLGELLWQVDQHQGLGDRAEFLVSRAKSRLSIWFDQSFDRDGDKVPEIKSSYFFDQLDQKPSDRSDPDQSNSYLESPGLSALLVNEIQKLRDLAELHGLILPPSALDGADEGLIEHINSSWNNDSKLYQTRDSISHLTQGGKVLKENLQNGLNRVGFSLSPPARLRLSQTRDSSRTLTQSVELIIHGWDHNGKYRIEKLEMTQESGSSYSQTIFSQLELINFKGADGSNLNLSSADSDQIDITLLFPLLGNIPTADLAETLVRETIILPERFWAPGGIRSFPGSMDETIHLPWNYLVCLGLLNYGYQTIASELLSKNLKGPLLGHLTRRTTSDLTNPTLGKRIKPILAAADLIPIRLMLQIAGVQISSQGEVLIRGQYPFSFPLRLYNRGASLVRTAEKTVISRPGKDKIVQPGNSELRIDLS